MVQAEHWSFATYFLKSVWNINLPDWMFHILPWENVSKILAMWSGLPRSNELDWGRMRQAGRCRAAGQQRSTDSTSTGSLGRAPALEQTESHVSQCLFESDSSRNFKNISRKTSNMFTQSWSLNLYQVTMEDDVKPSDYCGLLGNCISLNSFAWQVKSEWSK